MLKNSKLPIKENTQVLVSDPSNISKLISSLESILDNGSSYELKLSRPQTSSFDRDIQAEIDRYNQKIQRERKERERLEEKTRQED